MSYQINHNDVNKLVFDGEYVHYSIPVPPISRGCTTYALVRHFWYMCEFVHFVTHVLSDHVNRPLDITDKKKDYQPELKTGIRESGNMTLEGMMSSYIASMYGVYNMLGKDVE